MPERSLASWRPSARSHAVKTSRGPIRFISELAECRDELATRTFTVTIERDKETGYFITQCVELPAAISQGKTEEEAKKNIKEAIELVLEHLEEKAGVRKSGKKLIEVAV